MRQRAQPRVETRAPEIDREAGSALALRLAIGKDGLGIELARPAAIACIEVVELVVRLPTVRFPFDVTGGITKFRHRRGELERLAIELDSRRAARWAEPLLRGLLSAEKEKANVTIAPRAFGATVTILAEDRIALAFEVALVGTPDLVLVVHGARGANLPAPATALALRAAATLLGDHAKREGARFILGRAAAALARSLLPDAGVRAPGGADVVLAGSGESDGVLFVLFARNSEAAIPRPATLAHEAALLTRPGDDARFAGDYARARQHDIATLERAPRHGEIGRRIAEVDAHAGGRAEAAIATLRAADRMPYQGQLLGDLLVEAGDPNGAIAALLREGERDPSAAVSALVFARAAQLATDPADALSWLDAAMARAPALVKLRWERAQRRLTQGRLADARADFQELEAIAVGAADRHHVLRRAADVYRARGLGADAALLYERALLYRPDDPESVAGLGVALSAEGRAARGATLLARAIELATGNTAWMQLALARVLGDRLHDRPGAVARLRLVPDEAPEAIEARGLEGRYRGVLGDDAGASLAFARLRERAGHDEAALPWLDEAATFEEGRGELALAQAHLGAGLAIAPANVELEGRYRAISARLGRAAGMTQPQAVGREVRIAILPAPEMRDRTTLAAPPDASDARDRVTLNAPASLPDARDRVTLNAPASVRDPRDRVTLNAPASVRDPRDRVTLNAPASVPDPRDRVTLNAPASLPGVSLTDSAMADSDGEARDRVTLNAPSGPGAPTPEEDELRVEALTRTLQGDPTNDAVVDELAERLTRLGRSMELLALLSARLEDAPPDRKEQLLPRHRAVLERLELEARSAGRDGEADLFRMARDAS